MIIGIVCNLQLKGNEGAAWVSYCPQKTFPPVEEAAEQSTEANSAEPNTLENAIAMNNLL
jgi:hypothetical protein